MLPVRETDEKETENVDPVSSILNLLIWKKNVPQKREAILSVSQGFLHFKVLQEEATKIEISQPNL